jgi:hypothetical protein
MTVEQAIDIAWGIGILRARQGQVLKKLSKLSTNSCVFVILTGSLGKQPEKH